MGREWMHGDVQVFSMTAASRPIGRIWDRLLYVTVSSLSLEWKIEPGLLTSRLFHTPGSDPLGKSHLVPLVEMVQRFDKY